RFNPMRTAVYARGGAVILIAALLSSAVGLLALGDGVVSSAAGGLGMAGTFLICCLTLGEKSVLQLFRYGRS
ncbi:hypothetical protein, partial [Bradyrhizobium ottawaense]